MATNGVGRGFASSDRRPHRPVKTMRFLAPLGSSLCRLTANDGQPWVCAAIERALPPLPVKRQEVAIDDPRYGVAVR